jgi:hypothetical protein
VYARNGFAASGIRTPTYSADLSGFRLTDVLGGRKINGDSGSDIGFELRDGEVYRLGGNGSFEGRGQGPWSAETATSDAMIFCPARVVCGADAIINRLSSIPGGAPIELLVVVAIIALLTAILLPGLHQGRK